MLEEGTLELRDNPGRSRYEALLGARVAGFLDYEARADRVLLVHTEVPPELAGNGIAGRLAQTALDDLRDRGLKVVAVCRYVRTYVDRHPECAAGVVDEPPASPGS